MTAEEEKVTHRIRAEVTKKGQLKSEVIAISHHDEDGSCILSVQPKEKAEHLLSITVSGQHVLNSPFLLHVKTLEYYSSMHLQTASPDYIM